LRHTTVHEKEAVKVIDKNPPDLRGYGIAGGANFVEDLEIFNAREHEEQNASVVRAVASYLREEQELLGPIICSVDRKPTSKSSSQCIGK